MFQIVNFASLSFLKACVNKKPVIGFFWSRGRTVDGGQQRGDRLLCKRRFPCPAELRAVPAGALI